MLQNHQVVQILQICRGMTSDEMIQIFQEPNEAVTSEDNYNHLFAKAIQRRDEKVQVLPTVVAADTHHPYKRYRRTIQSFTVIAWAMHQRLAKKMRWTDIENWLKENHYDIRLKGLKIRQTQWYKDHGWTCDSPQTDEFLAAASQESILKWLETFQWGQ